MANEFKKLAILLRKRNVVLGEYQQYLTMLAETDYEKVTRRLKKRKVNVTKFHDYLDEQFPHESHYAETFVLNQSLEKLGLTLLKSSKVNVTELNSILSEIPREELSPRNFLRVLLRNRKIRVDEFLELDQIDWKTGDEEEEGTYRIRENREQVEFYLQKEEGKSFGNYQIIGELARGGMGIVYKAYHPHLNQTFALKVLISGEDATENALKRFHREVQTLAKLKHPGIIQITDSGIENNQHYFAMEFVEGKTLEDLIQQKIPIRKGLILIKKTLEALHYAHSQGIIHRDLKPSNIFVDLDNNPKIGDFGLARDTVLDAKSQKLTHSGAVIGTPRYMSPEQIRGEMKKLDARSDIYSIGVCLYQVLTKRCPHEAPIHPQLFQKILFEDPKLPSRINPAIHRDLDTIILKALEKNRLKRYQTAKSFALDLERFLDGYLIYAKQANYATQFIRWARVKRKPLIFGVTVILFSFSCLFYFQWTKYSERRARFLEPYQKAVVLLKKANETVATNIQQRTYKTKLLLNSLNYLNLALAQIPGEKEAERKKLKTIEGILPLAYQSQEYQLAAYVAKEIAGLHIISNEKKETLIKEVKERKSKSRNKHLQRFKSWLEKLQKGDLREGEEEDAIFEISKMKEKEVFKKLLHLLEQSTHYFLTGINRQPHLDRFYGTVVTILGRLGNPQAGPLIEKSLNHIVDRVSPLSRENRSVADINHLVLLSQSLAHFKDPRYFKVLDGIRWKMGQNSLFWERTTNANRKLLALCQVEEAGPLSDAETYNNRGKFKYDKELFKEAIEDFNQALKLDPKYTDAYLNRGNARHVLGNLDGAIEDYTKLLLLEPNYKIVYSNRGNSKYEKGDYDGAILDHLAAIKIDPLYDNAYSGVGSAYYMKNELDKAIQYFNKVLEINPKDARVLVLRGNSKRFLGKQQPAMEDYNEAILLRPRYGYAYHNRGLLYKDLEQFKNAILDFDQAIRYDPKYPEAYYERGKSKYEFGDFKGALADYEEAFRLDPKHRNACFEIAFVKYDLQDYDGSLEDYNKTLALDPEYAIAYFNRGLIKDIKKDIDGAIKDFKAAIRYQQDYAVAYCELGRMHNKKGDFETGMKYYEDAIRLEPKNGKRYYSRGLAKYDNNDYPGALKDFEKALELNPEDADASFRIGFTKYAQKDYDEAIIAYKNTLKLKPDDSYSHFNIGVIKKIQGELDESIARFTQSLRYKPKDEKAYRERGNAKLEQGNYDGAILDYSLAIRFSSNKGPVYVERAIAKKDKKDYRGAIQDYNLAIKLEPKNADFYRGRGTVKREQENYKEAIKDYNKAIELNPKLSFAYVSRAFLRQQQGDYKAAIKDFSAALQIKPDDYETYYDRGMAYKNQKQTAKAKADFQEYLKRTKENTSESVLKNRTTIQNLFPKLK